SASAAGTAAMTLVASSESPRTPTCNRLLVIFIVLFVLKMQCLEVHADAERNEVAVIHGAVLTAKDVGVCQACGVGVLVFSIDPKAHGLATFFEVTARARGIAADVMGPGHVRLEVHTGEHIGVFPDGAAAITPRVGRGETIVVAVAATVIGRSTRTGTVDGGGVEDLRAGVQTTRGWQFAWAEDRIAAVTDFGRAFQATDVSQADFTHQGQTLGAHDLIEEVRQGGLDLGDFLAAIAVQVFTRNASEQGGVGQRTAQWANPSEQNVSGVQLHRGIRTVADLTAPRGTGRQGG